MVEVPRTSILAKCQCVSVLIVAIAMICAGFSLSLNVSTVSAEEGEVIPKKERDAEKEFLKHYRAYLEGKLKAFEKDRPKLSNDEKSMPPYVTVTTRKGNEVRRTYYWISGLKRADIEGSVGMYMLGQGFYLSPSVDKIKWGDIDQDSIATFYPAIYARSLRGADLDVLPKLAIWCYRKKMPWAGNRVLRRYHDMLRGQPIAQKVVIDFVREKHGWDDNAEVVAVDFGSSRTASLKRQEFALKDPESNEASEDEDTLEDSVSDRRAQWEASIETELLYIAGLCKNYHQLGERLRFKDIGERPNFELAAFNWEQLDRMWKTTLERAAGSKTLENANQELEAAKAIEKERKRDEAIRKSVVHWHKVTTDNLEKVRAVKKDATTHFNKGESLYKADRDRGTNNSYPHFDKALEEMTKLVPDAGGKARGALDPANMELWYFTARVYLRACRPVYNTSDKASKEHYVRGAINMLNACLRTAPKNEGARFSLGRAHLLVSEYKKSRKYFQELVDEKSTYAVSAKRWLNSVENAEKNRN